MSRMRPHPPAGLSSSPGGTTDGQGRHPLVNVIFWNYPCKRKRRLPDLLPALARTVRHHDIDILVLADTEARPAEVLDALNGGSTIFEAAESPPRPHPSIQFYTRFPAKDLPPYRADDRVDIRRLRVAGRQEVLLAAIHFYDRRNYSIDDQAAKAPAVYRTIRDAEHDSQHNRTILFGDLNMNPFEAGMINFESGFASMATRELADRHGDPDYRRPQRFYNPTWSRLGRQAPHPSGTHYYKNVSKPTNVFWHHLDQVLIRPSLYGAFSDESFKILTSIPGPAGTPLELIRSTGKHWELSYSDHLPILFALDPPEETAHV
jgi:Endonuclease/Exonuclease/phosphatase family